VAGRQCTLRPSSILDFQKFKIITDDPLWGPICVTVPNFIKIGNTVAETWQFNGFFSKWRPSAILDLWNLTSLTVGAVKGPILHQHTKFRKYRWNHCGDIATFVIFQDGGQRHLRFSKTRNFNGRSAVRVEYASLYQISPKSVERLQRYGDLTFFFKMAAVRRLDLLGAYWDHPRWPLDGLHRCAKFDRNRCMSFDNMKLSIFCPFGLKTPIHAPKIGFFGGIWPPKWGPVSTKPPKGTSSGGNGSSGALIMSLYVIVPEKSRVNKKCGLFGIAVKWPWDGCMQLFWYLYVHSVEDSTLMPIFDQFCFSFVFLGLPKIGPNRYT